MPDEIAGVNMFVHVDGTAVIAQSSATLTTEPELVEAIVKNTDIPVKLPGDQEWMLEYEGQIPDDQGKHALTNGNAALAVGRHSQITGVDTGASTFTIDEDRSSDWSSGDTVRVYFSTGNDQEYEIDTVNGQDVTVVGSISDSTADGCMFKPQTLPGLQSVTLDLEQELDDTPPGIDEPTGWSYYTALRRDYSMSAEGHYYDPGNEPTYAEVHDARDAGETLAVELTILGLTFVGEIAASSMEIEAGTDDKAQYALEWGGSEDYVKTGTPEATIDTLITMWTDQTENTASLRHQEGGTDVSGSTFWEGTTLLSSLEIELARDEFPSIATELQGDGALTRNTA
jgi:hypothetical protein